MKRFALALVAGLTILGASSVAGALGTWSNPATVPNITTLAPGGADIRTIACSATGLCIGGGGYAEAGGDEHAFLTENTGSGWSNAFELPGVTAVPGLSWAMVRQISCSNDGGCSLVGDYGTGGTSMSFVATRGGGGAIDVPGLAAISTGNDTQSMGISCASAGNCSIVGAYVDLQSHDQVFVSNQSNGSWSTVQTLSGFTSPGYPTSISCGAADDCVVVGFVVGTPNAAFIVERTASGWGTPSSINTFASDNFLNSVSCVSAAFCVAAGNVDASPSTGFAISRIAGTWGPIDPIPNLATLAGSDPSRADSVSCWAVGKCSMTGTIGTAGNVRTWVADMDAGVWGDAQLVPGIAALGDGSVTTPKHVSCASSGLCAIAGQYVRTGGGMLAWVSVRSGGTWSNAHPLPPVGTATSSSYDDPDGLACSPTTCSVGGGFMDGQSAPLAWLADYTDGSDPTTTTTASSTPVTPAFTG